MDTSADCDYTTRSCLQH